MQRREEDKKSHSTLCFGCIICHCYQFWCQPQTGRRFFLMLMMKVTDDSSSSVRPLLPSCSSPTSSVFKDTRHLAGWSSRRMKNSRHFISQQWPVLPTMCASSSLVRIWKHSDANKDTHECREISWLQHEWRDLKRREGFLAIFFFFLTQSSS